MTWVCAGERPTCGERAPTSAKTMMMAAPTWMTRRLPTRVICIAPMFSLYAVVPLPVPQSPVSMQQTPCCPRPLGFRVYIIGGRGGILL